MPRSELSNPPAGTPRIDLVRAFKPGTRYKDQHTTYTVKLVHLARRLRIDQHLNVRRPFQQLSAAVMLNAGLARRANFTRPP